MLHRHGKNEQHKLLESRLAELEKNHISSPSPDLHKELLHICAALNTFLIQDSEQSLKFARQKLYEFGDKPGRYLANLVKKRADSQNLVSITDSNSVRSFDTRTINKHLSLSLMCQFFADLIFPKATDDQKLQLNAPITREEALLALKSMPSGKAPGSDGF